MWIIGENADKTMTPAGWFRLPCWGNRWRAWENAMARLRFVRNSSSAR